LLWEEAIEEFSEAGEARHPSRVAEWGGDGEVHDAVVGGVSGVDDADVSCEVVVALAGGCGCDGDGLGSSGGDGAVGGGASPGAPVWRVRDLPGGGGVEVCGGLEGDGAGEGGFSFDGVPVQCAGGGEPGVVVGADVDDDAFEDGEVVGEFLGEEVPAVVAAFPAEVAVVVAVGGVAVDDEVVACVPLWCDDGEVGGEPEFDIILDLGVGVGGVLFEEAAVGEAEALVGVVSLLDAEGAGALGVVDLCGGDTAGEDESGFVGVGEGCMCPPVGCESGEVGVEFGEAGELVGGVVVVDDVVVAAVVVVVVVGVVESDMVGGLVVVEDLGHGDGGAAGDAALLGGEVDGAEVIVGCGLAPGGLEPAAVGGGAGGGPLAVGGGQCGGALCEGGPLDVAGVEYGGVEGGDGVESVDDVGGGEGEEGVVWVGGVGEGAGGAVGEDGWEAGVGGDEDVAGGL